MNNFWIDYFFPLITIFGFIILYFTIKNLLPSYFTEKGKNIASKEDISELTRLVETVKHNFTKETEHLKTNLNFLTNIHGSLISEERNAIIDYNEKYFMWLNALLDTGFNNLDDYDNIEIEKYRTFLEQLYKNLLNSEARLGLFIDNHDLVSKAHDLKITTLQLISPFPHEYLLEIKHQNVDIKYMRANAPLNEQSEKYASFVNKRKVLYRNFSDTLINNYRDVSPLTHDFQMLCREHIYNLIKKNNEHEEE